MNMFRMTVVAAALVATQATAEPFVGYESNDAFEDVVFALENAIVGKGLVIDSISHVGDMLERTRSDVGSDVVLFTKADVFSFCSAALSRKVMEADLANIQYCPYDIFVMQTPDKPDVVTVGYRPYPDGPMKEVEALIDSIAREASGTE
ncbi:DUF302 domain-containing protein [Pseudogemmobacter sp. W21_MBD1_M6]|uniref:DUF302 domain-containing protein n=1 Tax=Pseudogemmobacter sp. W21_MBD1_M6 TaxID=3240271 RepID=UPI003F965B94